MRVNDIIVFMTMWVPDIGSAEKPIYLAIADALEADVSAGRLERGTRLPPQRELAYQLGITLGTVTRAYAEAERRRLVRGETGRGTYIAPESQAVSPLVPVEDDADDTCDLARNFAYSHLNPELASALVRMAKTPGIDRLNRFVPSEGLRAHRETGTLVFNDYGLEADPARVAITCGAQHGLQVACQAFFRQGDGVAVDAFTYPSILNSLETLGLNPVPVPARRQQDGSFGSMEPDSLRQAARAQGVKGVFLMPNMHNPTTYTMPLEEREELVEIARECDLKIVEDDPYTPFLTERLPAFGALAPERTASIASISKICSPGSRIGFIHVPEPYADAVRNKIGESTWMASPITAELVSGWVRDGTFQKTLKRKRAVNRHRVLAAKEILAPYALYCEEEKVFGWLALPEEVDPDVIQTAMAQQNIAVLSARYFQTRNARRAPFLRITFGSVESDDLFRTALQKLQSTISQFAASPSLGQLVG